MGDDYKGATKNTDANALIAKSLEDSKSIEAFGKFTTQESSLRLELKLLNGDVIRQRAAAIQSQGVDPTFVTDAIICLLKNRMLLRGLVPFRYFLFADVLGEDNVKDGLTDLVENLNQEGEERELTADLQEMIDQGILTHAQAIQMGPLKGKPAKDMSDPSSFGRRGYLKYAVLTHLQSIQIDDEGAETMEPFIPAATFEGKWEGYAFKSDASGVGYYLEEVPKEAKALAAKKDFEIEQKTFAKLHKRLYQSTESLAHIAGRRTMLVKRVEIVNAVHKADYCRRTLKEFLRGGPVATLMLRTEQPEIIPLQRRLKREASGGGGGSRSSRGLRTLSPAHELGKGLFSSAMHHHQDVGSRNDQEEDNDKVILRVGDFVVKREKQIHPSLSDLGQVTFIRRDAEAAVKSLPTTVRKDAIERAGGKKMWKKLTWIQRYAMARIPSYVVHFQAKSDGSLVTLNMDGHDLRRASAEEIESYRKMEKESKESKKQRCETKEESGSSRAVVPSLAEVSLLEIIKLAKEENDCRGMVDAMREGRSSKVVLGKGLEAVASLCEQRDDHRVMFGIARVIPLLLEVMREHKGSEEIARVIFLAVWYLTRNEDIRKIIGRSGEIPLLVEMLEEHGERNAEVAKNGLVALQNLAIDDDNEKRIVEAGGIAMILRMLEVHGESNAGVAKNGCGVLRNLTFNDDNRKSITEAGGIAMVLSLMEVHGASNAGVAEQGCAALRNLAVNDDNQKSIAEVGGIAMILRVMEVHGASNVEVAKYGCAALRNLAANDDNQKRIGEAGGIAMILRVMKEHGASDVEVAKNGCGALRNLACNANNQKRIIEAGGIAMILRMMERHGESNASVAKNGCAVLWNLAINAENKRKILTANGVSMVERMKSTWASNEEVQAMANGALTNLR